MEDAVTFAEGSADPKDFHVRTPSAVDVRKIRRQQGLTQKAFAARYGFSIGRLRDWEQNRSHPDGPSRVLLTVIQKEPEAIERALSGNSDAS